MGVEPGNKEVMFVTIEDKESIMQNGVKQTFDRINSIDNVIEAIQRAKNLLMTNRMKTREVEINCEPIFDLRPGYKIQVFDVASGLSGQYIIDTININYSKNGGATQVIKGYTWGNILDTSTLEGKVAYFSKEGKDGDVLKYQQQLSESEIKSGVFNSKRK
jgi:hypothetical protein